MSTERANDIDRRTQSALAELQQMIREGYPEATFEISHGDDPEGEYLIATVDVEDTDEVVDVFIDRLVEMQVEEGLPVYVIPIRPLERVLDYLQSQGLPRSGPLARALID